MLFGFFSLFASTGGVAPDIFQPPELCPVYGLKLIVSEVSDGPVFLSVIFVGNFVIAL